MPKGATLSHFNIVNNARFVTDRIALTPADRLVIPVPVYHCFGMVMGVLGAVSVATACLLPGSPAFDVANVQRGAEIRLSVEHPTGEMTVILAMNADESVASASILRTARKLMDGIVFGE